MTRSASTIQRPLPDKVTDPDLIAIRAKLLDALAAKASALVTPLATNVSPRSSRAGAVRRRSSGSRSRSRPRRSSHGPSPRVVVGRDAVKNLPVELARLHLSSPLIVSSPSRLDLARKIQAIIPNLDSRILSSSIIAIPARISGRDCVVSLGGGSAVTLARAVGLRKGIPHICIPTTYSGNEMIPKSISLGRRERGAMGESMSRASKEIAKKSKLLPTVIIYDENLTISSPTRFSAPSNEDVMKDLHRAGPGPKSEDAYWSYIHLPGV
ncbi:hypothetical protein BHE90_010589 [Fusarium euwallaceae]|uniref:Alcohol dehydrogenase iron-type/glycerol dehydrogenase GldA domain-containing protein n=3 Tax=Fusarium solani species complex TaxID=232080 RepID=A0A3M2RQZ2_9HYPO|nr:hypothetical protein CDV36_012677 [Fusarium kuroshium]RSL80158.1 hypothetical protein CEP51_006799 [Fusarium floridanum]RTE74976.1 hypothetical protein BHE90_010589 [Fusarium euwallaceae]